MQMGEEKIFSLEEYARESAIFTMAKRYKSNSQNITKQMQMKIRKILLAMVLLSAALGVRAQQPQGTWSVIPKAGVALANLSGAKLYYSDGGGFMESKGKYNSRFVGGVEVEWQGLPTTSISLGALYAQQGCRYRDFEASDYQSVGIGYGRLRQKMDYLCVPLMVNQYLVEGFAVKAGVQMGFLCNSKVSMATTEITHHSDGAKEYGETVRSNNDDMDMRRKVDVAIPVGLSYEYLNVVLEVRYVLGLIQTYKDKAMPSEKNRAFYITAGYKFNL